MKIMEALKTQHDVRLSVGTRWIVWGDDDRWIVYSRGYRKKTSRVVVATKNETEAVRHLMEQVEDD